jgi:hypothetical protein
VSDSPDYVERLFPEPVDQGIALSDRAVSSVTDGTRIHLEGRGGEGKTWYEGGHSMIDQAVPCITVYPPTRGDHKGYKGNLLNIRELRGGELRFDGCFRPQWPSNEPTVP